MSRFKTDAGRARQNANRARSKSEIKRLKALGSDINALDEESSEVTEEVVKKKKVPSARARRILVDKIQGSKRRLNVEQVAGREFRKNGVRQYGLRKNHGRIV